MSQNDNNIISDRYKWFDESTNPFWSKANIVGCYEGNSGKIY